jgi:hypothetical protein
LKTFLDKIGDAETASRLYKSFVAHVRTGFNGERAIFTLSITMAKLLFLLLLYVTQTLAGSYFPPEAYCLYAVYQAYGKYYFQGGAATSPQTACENQVMILSMYMSGNMYCTDAEMTAGITHLNEMCVTGKVPVLPSVSSLSMNLTANAASSAPMVDCTSSKGSHNVSSPSIITSGCFDTSLKTVVQLERTAKLNKLYRLVFLARKTTILTKTSYASYGYWGGVVLLGTLWNIIQLLLTKYYLPTGPDTEKVRTQKRKSHILDPVIRLMNSFTTNLIIPPVFGSHHQVPKFSFIIPTRLEAIIVYGYWTVTLILCSVHILAFQGNLSYTSVAQQVWTNVANRAAHMALGNLAVLWMFSGRNNIFQWTTGWNFATFNIFHRHIARIVAIQGVLHGIGHTVTSFEKDMYLLGLKERWFVFGIIASFLSFLLETKF